MKSAIAVLALIVLTAHPAAAAGSCSGQVTVCLQSTCTGKNFKACNNQCRVVQFQNCMNTGTWSNKFVQTNSGLKRR